MKYVFFNKNSDENDEAKEVVNLKLYKINTRYLNSFTPEMLEILHQHTGKSLNDLPFLGSFLNKYKTVLLKFTYSEDKVSYLLEYNIEKIEFNGTMPVRRIIHTRVECRHYIEQNFLLLVQKEDLEDKYTLSIATLLPYYLILKTSYGALPSYKPPKWQEVSLTMVELASVSTILGEMIDKQLEGPLPLSELYNKLISGSTSHIKTAEVKPYRNNSYIVRVKSLPLTQRIVIDIKCGFKYNHILQPYVIDEIINIIMLLKQKNISTEILIPVGTTLKEYFTLVHPDMYEEALLKLERKIIDDFINLIKFQDDAHKKVEDISYVFFTAAFNTLISLGHSSQQLRDSSCEYSFSYEALFAFIGKYLKLRHNTNLSEPQLESLFKKFLDIVSPYKGKLSSQFL